MRSFRLIASAVLVATLAMSAGASPTSIGAFFDVDATDCDALVDPWSHFNVYVSAVLGTDAAGSGITGGSLRVAGLTGIVSSVTPNPASMASIGNPILGGGEVAFPTCMTGEGPRHVVLLYTIACIAGETASPRTVTVTHSSTPSGSWPISVVLCDDPVYTRLYVSGAQAFINNGSCTVDVAPMTWSLVKAFYTANSVLQPPAPRGGQR